MKKIITFIMMIALVFSFWGCGNDPGNIPETPDNEPGMIGYVMDKDNGGRILVVDSNPQDFSSNGGVDEFYNAIWFSNVQEDIEIGNKVKVWFDAVAESYPGQSEAVKIEVIPAVKPEGADLNESQAIYKALNSDEINTSWPIAVKSVKYNNESDIWELEMKETIGEEMKTFNIQIQDKI